MDKSGRQEQEASWILLGQGSGQSKAKERDRTCMCNYGVLGLVTARRDGLAVLRRVEEELVKPGWTMMMSMGALPSGSGRG